MNKLTYLFFLVLDYYRHFGFDPFGSGDFDFADATLIIPEYSLALILYLSTLEHQYKVYPDKGRPV